jgi:hypothetical protein
MLLAFATALFVCVSAPIAFASMLQISVSYAQRKVSSGQFPIRSACMMPPQGYLSKVGFNGPEDMTQESESWAKALEDIVEANLKARGISVTSAANPLSTGASDGEIKEVITQVQQKFKTVSALVYKKPGDIAKSAYTLGDQVGMLPCSENSDIVVFVQGRGKIFTAGGPGDSADLFVTMADAKTGEILDLIHFYPDCNFLLVPEACYGPVVDIELASKNIGSIPKPAKKARKSEP